MKKDLYIIDTTLRDGSHAVSHGFTEEHARKIAGGLDKCGVDIIEISHGDGITGSTYNYGFSKVDELKLLEAAAEEVNRAKLTVLLIPGIGTVKDLEAAKERGATAVRIATHVTEADISRQHIGAAKEMGLFTVGFLMMVHVSTPEQIAEQAMLMESYGADYINLADSAGYMLPEDVAARIKAVKSAIKIPVGYHAHNNLSLAIADTIAAIDAGATYIDATLRGMGAGAGNAQLEVLAGVLQRKNINAGLDFYGLMDLAENVVQPIMPRPLTINTAAMMLGYAGVYSSFLLHVYGPAEKYGIEPRDILVELGRRGMVGGQEDMIIDVAYQLSKKK